MTVYLFKVIKKSGEEYLHIDCNKSDLEKARSFEQRFSHGNVAAIGNIQIHTRGDFVVRLK
jgi:hypothetical protein|tara:strand:+ start:559 stop:741 length:183 start_codon:yes stop_codon:yes gene_type:complete